MMRKNYYRILATVLFALCLGGGTTGSLHAQSNDSVWVQTFTFDSLWDGSVFRGYFEFPEDTNRWEKILMYYTLRCDASTPRDQYPCGEWDYLTYTYLWDSTGTMDSTYRSGHNFRVNGAVVDTFHYSQQPTWTYWNEWQYFITHSGVTAFDSAILGTGNTTMNHPLGTSATDGRAQFIWKAAELSSAGLAAGNITGLRLNLATLGSSVRNLTIKMKHSTLDSLTPGNYETGGFTQVYRLNKTFSGTGWNDLQLTTPFSWNGSDNIVVEFSFDGDQAGTDNVVLGQSTAYSAGVYTSGTDYYLDFPGGGKYVNLRDDAQVTGANPRTIEAWAYTRGFNNGGLFQAGITGSTGQDFSLRTRTTVDGWRAQMWGSPDFDFTLNGSQDAWHHIAMVFNGTSTTIYYDGQQVAQNVTSINTAAHDIWVGRWNGSYFNGKVDEVRIWNTALSQSTIENWMGRDLSPSHPNYANLTGYYPFNEGTGIETADASGNANPDGFLVNPPAWQEVPGEEMFRNWNRSFMRPNIIFEQGVYTTSNTDSILSVDSTQNSAAVITQYNNPAGGVQIPDNDPNHPSLVTDTLMVWEAGTWSYTYSVNTGLKVDSTWITPDSSLIRETKEWYSPVVRYEIGRFITPYGINLDLGPQGFTWLIDVTDYAPLLSGWKRIQSGNNQEQLDLKFLFIKGKPSRDVRSVRNLWNGNWSYRSMADGNNVTPKDVLLDGDAAGFRLKTRTSGHGFGSGQNCAEFCRKEHRLFVDGSMRFFWDVWKECADNPVYPQGGTWIYDRAGWCPGAETDVYNWELTSYVNPGDSVNIDYGVEGYPSWGGNGNYVLNVDLVSYDTLNHQVDAAVERIISPNTWGEYNRRNPICANPVVEIINRGAQTLSSLDIKYGVVGGAINTYSWTGSLGFEETEKVELPLVSWAGSANMFTAWTENPNGTADEYLRNDTAFAPFSTPPSYPNEVFLLLRTNAAANETKYTLADDQGNILYQSSPFWGANSIYRDTFRLQQGCYTLHITDSDGDGLSFFANNDGNGFVRLMDATTGSNIRNFDPDFGNDIYLQFTVDTPLGEAVEMNDNTFLDVYPNPATDRLNVYLETQRRGQGQFIIRNLHGAELMRITRNLSSGQEFSLDLNGISAGIYFLDAWMDGERISKKFVVKK